MKTSEHQKLKQNFLTTFYNAKESFSNAEIIIYFYDYNFIYKHEQKHQNFNDLLLLISRYCCN